MQGFRVLQVIYLVYYCKHRIFSDLTKIANNRDGRKELLLDCLTLYVIQAGKKSLKILALLLEILLI